MIIKVVVVVAAATTEAAAAINCVKFFVVAVINVSRHVF